MISCLTSKLQGARLLKLRVSIDDGPVQYREEKWCSNLNKRN